MSGQTEAEPDPALLDVLYTNLRNTGYTLGETSVQYANLRAMVAEYEDRVRRWRASRSAAAAAAASDYHYAAPGLQLSGTTAAAATTSASSSSGDGFRTQPIMMTTTTTTQHKTRLQIRTFQQDNSTSTSNHDDEEDYVQIQEEDRIHALLAQEGKGFALPGGRGSGGRVVNGAGTFSLAYRPKAG